MCVSTVALWVLTWGLIGGLDAGATFTVWHVVVFLAAMLVSWAWYQKQ